AGAELIFVSPQIVRKNSSDDRERPSTTNETKVPTGQQLPDLQALDGTDQHHPTMACLGLLSRASLVRIQPGALVPGALVPGHPRIVDPPYGFSLQTRGYGRRDNRGYDLNRGAETSDVQLHRAAHIRRLPRRRVRRHRPTSHASRGTS